MLVAASLPPLSEFCGPNRVREYMTVLQGDAARRGTRLFCQWAFKPIYLDSQESRRPSEYSLPLHTHA